MPEVPTPIGKQRAALLSFNVGCADLCGYNSFACEGFCLENDVNVPPLTKVEEVWSTLHKNVGNMRAQQFGIS